MKELLMKVAIRIRFTNERITNDKLILTLDKLMKGFLNKCGSPVSLRRRFARGPLLFLDGWIHLVASLCDIHLAASLCDMQHLAA
jgi:hypothetical protein